MPLRKLQQEPFRIFFPLGVVCGLIGVALWPLYYAGHTDFYPAPIHSRLMGNGLVGAFITGFLGTAVPRLIGIPSVQKWHLLSWVALIMGFIVMSLGHRFFWADLLFLVWISSLFGVLLAPFPKRKDLPPPGFILVILGLVSAMAGAAFGMLQEMSPEMLWPGVWHRLLTYQAFGLFPILGVAPYLAPRVLGFPSPHEFRDTLIPSADWMKKTAFAAAAGFAILFSFWLESSGKAQAGQGLRFAASAFYLFMELPLLKKPRIRSSLGFALRVGLFLVPTGFLIAAVQPAFRVGFLHITFIGGFGMMLWVTGTRVILGHAGRLELSSGRRGWIWIVLLVMIGSLVNRVIADFWPAIIPTHYTYAALLWISGMLVWCGFVFPFLLWNFKNKSR